MGFHKIKSDTPTMKHKNLRNDDKGSQTIYFSSVTSLDVNNQTV